MPNKEMRNIYARTMSNISVDYNYTKVDRRYGGIVTNDNAIFNSYLTIYVRLL